jgi:hypothetical protein
LEAAGSGLVNNNPVDVVRTHPVIKLPNCEVLHPVEIEIIDLHAQVAFCFEVDGLGLSVLVACYRKRERKPLRYERRFSASGWAEGG